MHFINTITLLGIIIPTMSTPHYLSTASGINIDIDSEKVTLSNFSKTSNVQVSGSMTYTWRGGKTIGSGLTNQNDYFLTVVPDNTSNMVVTLYPNTDSNMEILIDNTYFIINENSSHPVVGDVNFDGIINIADLCEVDYAIIHNDFMFIYGFGEYRADINRDGYVDSFDLTTYRKYLLNQ